VPNAPIRQAVLDGSEGVLMAQLMSYTDGRRMCYRKIPKTHGIRHRQGKWLLDQARNSGS
jgi:hypothetical protein